MLYTTVRRPHIPPLTQGTEQRRSKPFISRDTTPKVLTHSFHSCDHNSLTLSGRPGQHSGRGGTGIMLAKGRRRGNQHKLAGTEAPEDQTVLTQEDWVDAERSCTATTSSPTTVFAAPVSTTSGHGRPSTSLSTTPMRPSHCCFTATDSSLTSVKSWRSLLPCSTEDWVDAESGDRRAATNQA
ncbi:hypothetical protein E2C01_009924 [Portunus trituberculatus]|uniref:Uncharacterized protein n=1 Tax=Portunus trituberculatus TaxID=210409 RepID=A0A5B7D724_PORTR|nr:hypothetical protein [Portunus trituberculatus]